MAIFSSRNLIRDPEPYERAYNGADPKRVTAEAAGMTEGWYENVYGEIVVTRFAPRPEYAHAPHNKPNPILLAFRPIYTADSARWYKDHPAAVPGVRTANWGHIDHARRVLTRLANLTKES